MSSGYPPTPEKNGDHVSGESEYGTDFIVPKRWLGLHLRVLIVRSHLQQGSIHHG